MSPAFKKLSLSQAWQHVPVVLATWETEVEGLLEPRGSSPAWATHQDLIYKTLNLVEERNTNNYINSRCGKYDYCSVQRVEA